MSELIGRLRHLLAATLASLSHLQPNPVEAAAPPAVAEAACSPQEILAELRGLLAESDSAALDLWRDHEQMLRTVLPPTLGKQMDQAINRFQFVEAFRLLTGYQGH